MNDRLVKAVAKKNNSKKQKVVITGLKVQITNALLSNLGSMIALIRVFHWQEFVSD